MTQASRTDLTQIVAGFVGMVEDMADMGVYGIDSEADMSEDVYDDDTITSLMERARAALEAESQVA